MEFSGKQTITSIISGGKRKIHATYPDKSELIEEYDMKTHELLSRKWKKQSDFKESKWVYEIGDFSEENSLLKANLSNPIFIRKDTEKEFKFRIRNLPYEKDVFEISIDEEKNQIVIKTTNKKYYKRIEIPDIIRAKVKLQKGLESWSFSNNTLIISYPKPDIILKKESDARKEFDKLNAKKPKEGDIECVQQ